MSLIDLSEVKITRGEMVPAGNYPMRCMEASVHTTKNGTGKFIKCKFKVEGGEYNGRFVYHNFNFMHTNPDTQRIGLEQLKTFLKAAGQDSEKLETESALLGLVADAKVDVRVDPIYGSSNVIKFFMMPKTTTLPGEGEVPAAATPF